MYPRNTPASSDTDEQLVIAYQAGGDDAFVMLAERWEPWARTLAARHMGAAFSYETLRQDALVGLWKAARRFPVGDGRPFASYAARAMRNQVLITLRDGYPWILNITSGLDPAHYLSTHTVDDVAINRMKLIAVVEVIEAMSPARRQVMRLTVAGYQPRDIARVLNKNPNTVARHLRDGREQLRRVA